MEKFSWDDIKDFESPESRFKDKSKGNSSNNGSRRLKTISFLVAISLLGIIASTGSLIHSFGKVSLSANAKGKLVKVNGMDCCIEVQMEDSDSDGFPDFGILRVTNEGDFSFRGRVVDLSVRKGDEVYLTNLTGNGIWYFYSDEDYNGEVTPSDILVGKVKIEQGSSSLERDVFVVSANGEKELRIRMYYAPYAEEGEYKIEFEIITLYE